MDLVPNFSLAQWVSIGSLAFTYCQLKTCKFFKEERMPQSKKRGEYDHLTHLNSKGLTLVLGIYAAHTHIYVYVHQWWLSCFRHISACLMRQIQRDEKGSSGGRVWVCEPMGWACWSLKSKNTSAQPNLFVIAGISTWPAPANPYNSLVFIQEIELLNGIRFFFILIITPKKL